MQSSTYSRFLPLGLGLCYLGKFYIFFIKFLFQYKFNCNRFYFIGRKGAIEATSAALEVLGDPLKSLSLAVLSMCAYAGTGDVLVIQEMLHICSEHYDTDVRLFRKFINFFIFNSLITFKLYNTERAINY